jgi:hypothetical protein
VSCPPDDHILDSITPRGGGVRGPESRARARSRSPTRLRPTIRRSSRSRSRACNWPPGPHGGGGQGAVDRSTPTRAPTPSSRSSDLAGSAW